MGMNQAGLGRLERELSRRGELALALLIIAPLSIELFVRYGLSAGLFLLVTMGCAYGLVFYLRTHSPFGRNGRLLFVLISYFFMFTVLVWLLSNPPSPLIMLGAIISAFVALAFNLRGTVASVLLMDGIVIASYVFHEWGNFEGATITELISTIAILSLLAYFITSLIKRNQVEIEELNHTYLQLKAEHLRLVSLINTLGDAIIATDREGRIQIYNGAALELLNTNASLSGRQLDSMWQLSDSDGRPVNLIKESTRLNQNFRRSDLVIKYSENDQANLYVNVTPIKVGYGASAEQGFTFIVRDITKEKSLDEERDEFIAVVSHELRTPITITEGKISNAQLLMAKPHTSKTSVVDSLEAAHAQVVYLSNMINDLAALARAERDDASISLEKVEPAKLVTDLVKSYEIEAKQKNLSLSSHLSGRPLPELFTSRLYLQEILQNFITNAIKYTKSGGVTVSVDSEKAGQVTFTVADTGIGISTSDLKKIFEKFFRSEDYRTRENSGTGLGLYVTMKLAKKINAIIDVKSQINEGSTFLLKVRSMPPIEPLTARGEVRSELVDTHYVPSN